MNGQKGQSLLELTITLGIAVVIISGLTITTLVSLRNSQLAQNQLQATKLAQEGLDLVKTARSKNCGIYVDENNTVLTTPYYWYGSGTLVWSKSYPSVNPIHVTATLTDSPQPCGLRKGDETQIFNRFTRTITISDSATSAKKITATVSWADISGSHQSQLVTILTNH